MNHSKSKLTQSDLGQFRGGGTVYKHGIFARIVYTEGVQYLAAHGGAYWLLDAIGIHLLSPTMKAVIEADPRIRSLHFWTLTVAEDESALLIAQADSPEKPFITQEIDYTDFPLKEVRIWVAWQGEQWLLFLPSEY